MLSVEIRFVMQGKEVSVDSFVETIGREICASLRKEISRALPTHEQQDSDSPRRVKSEMPRQAVSVREAAHLLSISPRTVDKYVALKVIRTVRVGRRVLVPMKSVEEVVASGEVWPSRSISPGIFERKMEDAAKGEPKFGRKCPHLEVSVLKQVKGVGNLIALTFVLAIEDPHRFRKSRDVGCFIGLRPGRRNSGQSQPQLHCDLRSEEGKMPRNAPSLRWLGSWQCYFISCG